MGGGEGRSRRRWLVDGMNLIGSRADGWWHDREGAMRSLVEELAALATSRGDEVTVVFDGRARSTVEDAGGEEVEVAFAPGAGPDAADHVIVDRVATDDRPGDLVVVTSDRRLGARVENAGGQVVTVSAFERVLDGGRT